MYSVGTHPGRDRAGAVSRGSGCRGCDFIGFHEVSLCRELGDCGLTATLDKPVNMYWESFTARPLHEICIAKPSPKNRAFLWLGSGWHHLACSLSSLGWGGTVVSALLTLGQCYRLTERVNLRVLCKL